MSAMSVFAPTSFFGDRERKISIRPGVDILLGDFRLEGPGLFPFRSSGGSCELAFVLSGTIRNRIRDVEREVVVPPRYAAVWVPPSREGFHGCAPGEDIRFACISIQCSLFDSLGANAGLSAVSEQVGADHRLFPMNAAMQAAVQQIFLCPYRGCAGMVFLEAKALELISHIMAELCPYPSDLPGSPGDPLYPRVGPNSAASAGIFPAMAGTSQLRHVRRILLGSMVSPPSLAELAARAGLSVTTLTRGFRKIYGVSVFEFLRNERLEKAKMLLESGEANVTEAAYAVGFSSPAHLTRLFSRRFGISPSKLRRSVSSLHSDS